MSTAYLSTTLVAIVANGFSGIAALLHFQPIMAGMAKAGVPVSWLTFPIGTLKTLGALGLAAGLAFRPLSFEQGALVETPLTRFPILMFFWPQETR